MTNLPQGREGISPEEVFGEPISVYTDTDAVENGTIVDLIQFTRVLFHGLPINRMTRHLFEDFKPFLQDEGEEEDAKKLGAKLGSILRTKLLLAQKDPGNSGEVGDIFTIPPKLWLVLNEVGGWTAMYPEDY